MKLLIALTVCFSIFVFVTCQENENKSSVKYNNGTWKPIYEIAENGTLQDIEELIKNGADVNLKNASSGSSPLHYAAKRGDDDIVKLLLDHGANIDSVDKSEMTPLLVAVSSENERTAKFLIEKGANVNARSDSNFTALINAARFGFDDLVELLLTKGADINAKEQNGFSALHAAAQNGFEKTVEILLENHADINSGTNEKRTPLYSAVDRDHEQIINMLIEKGADVNIGINNGWTPLHRAAYHGYDHIVKKLIEEGADVNAETDKGVTPLYLGAILGREKIVKMLLKNDAEVEISAKDGDTAIAAAQSKGFVRIVQMLKAVPRPAQRACKSYDTLPVERIVGGELAEEEEFPFIAALGYINPDTNNVTFRCGGTVITEFFVLTAAHCVKRPSIPVVVRLGKTSLLDDINDIAPPINRRIRYIRRHPDFSSTKKKNDIALIRLSERIDFFNDVLPACLQTDLRDESPDVKLIVAGWGTTSPEHESLVSNDLRKAQVKSMPLAECNETLWNWNQLANHAALRDGVSASQYCAYDPQGKNDSCQGDSGGPLQIPPSRPSESAIVIGVVSYGASCASALPALYTRVAYYMDWIESIVWPRGVYSSYTITH